MPCKLLAFASHHMIPSRDRSPAGVDTRSSSRKVKPPIAGCQVSSPVVVSPFGNSGLGSNFTCNDQRPESAFIRLGNSEAFFASVSKPDELLGEFCICWFAGVGEAGVCCPSIATKARIRNGARIRLKALCVIWFLLQSARHVCDTATDLWLDLV